MKNNLNSTVIYKKIYSLLSRKISLISNEISNSINSIMDQGEIEQEILLDILIERQYVQKTEITLLEGFIFEKLKQSKIKIIKNKINQFFPDGIIKLKTSLNIDYQPLQFFLIQKKFKEADKLTQDYLCKLANLKQNNKRSWLYFTDISSLPSDDLFTIDLLWRIYSQGKFGFSIQRKIWIINNYNWDKLWDTIGWIQSGVMKRYPQEFIWTMDAPQGHLPLMNQLRGTQVIYSLFKHVVWKDVVE